MFYCTPTSLTIYEISGGYVDDTGEYVLWMRETVALSLCMLNLSPSIPCHLIISYRHEAQQYSNNKVTPLPCKTCFGQEPAVRRLRSQLCAAELPELLHLSTSAFCRCCSSATTSPRGIHSPVRVSRTGETFSFIHRSAQSHLFPIHQSL